MAKAAAASLDGQSLTKKQLKRLERKRKKHLAEAGLLHGSPSDNPSVTLADNAVAGDVDSRREDNGDKSALATDFDAKNVAPGGGISREGDADKEAVRAGISREADADKAPVSADQSNNEDDIRNSLVGKVAEALLRKQLEEERASVPARKKAKLENRASEAPATAAALVSEQPKREGKKKKETKKEKKEKKKEKKRRKNGRDAGEPSADVSQEQGPAPASESRKRQREEKASAKKKRKGTMETEEEGKQMDSPPIRTGKMQKGKQKEAEGKEKKRKGEQPSPWPEIHYEALSAQAVLRGGQSLMIDGAANVTLVSGGASVMGYRLRKGEEVLVTSCGQLAPVSIIVYDRARGRAQIGGARERGDSVQGEMESGEGEWVESVLLFRSYWPRKSDGGSKAGGQRTFRLEAKAPAGSSRTPSKATPDPDPKSKAAEIQLQPTIIPLAWKTVTDSIVGESGAATRAAENFGGIAKPNAPDDVDGTGAGTKAAAAEAGVSERPPIVVVCGGKNVGKSTYGRYLVNRLLNRYPAVAYLETDVGQPEFTAPGLLSSHLLTSPVLGPPSTHLRDPDSSFFYGDVSAKTDPELYLRCVVALYDGFRRKHYDGAAEGKQIPLVINTHGWVKGLGLDVLIDILRYTVPTHVVDVQSAKANKNLPPGNFWETTVEPLSRVHYVPTAVPDQPDASAPFAHKFAPEERALRLLAHFQTATVSGNPPGLSFSENDAFSQLATCLVHHRPFQVRLDAVRIYQLHGYVPPEEALWALNGAVVGLAKEAADGETGPMPWCEGIGLVRGIDPARGVLFLVTCLPLSVLRGVNTLIQGKVDLPLQLLSAPPYVSPYLAFSSIAAEGTGSAMVKSRNNIIRKVGD